MRCPTCGKMCASEKGMKQHHTRSHGTSLNDVTVSCDYCGKDVDKKKSDLKKVDNTFCSTECENSWRSDEYSGQGHHNYKPKKSLSCEFCGDEFKVYEYREDSARFCSQECSGNYKTEQGTEQVSCDWCDNTFKKAKRSISRSEHDFCSKDCYGCWSSVNKTGQNHPNWTGGADLYEAIRENLSDKSWNTIAELSRNDSCYKCGREAENLHEHHIIPVMYGGVNSEELLITLCPSCHRTVESYTMNTLTTDILSVV